MPTINWTDPILLSAAGLVVTLAVTAGGIIWQLSRLTNKLDNVDEVSSSLNSLTTQLNTITNTYDVSTISDVRNDIRGINDSMGEVTAHADKIDEINDSVNTIESSITNVSLKTMEEILENMGDAFSARNSVRYEMEKSGVETIISLTSIADEQMEVQFRFSESIEARTIVEMIGSDEELTEKEMEMLGSEPEVYATSPRDMTFICYTEDIDAIADWINITVCKIDEYYIKLNSAKSEFDSKVEESLKTSDSEGVT